MDVGLFGVRLDRSRLLLHQSMMNCSLQSPRPGHEGQ
jgi:hypothetical protein